MATESALAIRKMRFKRDLSGGVQVCRHAACCHSLERFSSPKVSDFPRLENTAIGGGTLCPGHAPWRNRMIILGLVLLILGIVLSVNILYVIGGILLIVGVVLWLLGAMGRAVGGRRHYY